MSVANNKFVAHRVAAVQVGTAWLLKNARLNAGIEQAEFADRMGLSQSQISRIESGQVDISLSILTLWALVCECQVYDLLDGGP